MRGDGAGKRMALFRYRVLIRLLEFAMNRARSLDARDIEGTDAWAALTEAKRMAFVTAQADGHLYERLEK